MTQCPNGWLVAPGKAARTKRITVVPCGRCSFCRKRRAKEWSMRLRHELAVCHYAYFVTLTYDDDHIKYLGKSLYPTLCKEDMVNYIKRLRKFTTIRYAYVGEYGERTQRPHYHALIFSKGMLAKEFFIAKWPFGMVHVGIAEPASINYVMKYMLKSLEEKRAMNAVRLEPFCRFSQRLGFEFALNNAEQILNNKTIKENGIDNAIPRYYLKKGLVPKFEMNKLRISYEEQVYKDYIESGLEWADWCRKQKAEKNQRVLNIDAKNNLYRGDKL